MKSGGNLAFVSASAESSTPTTFCQLCEDHKGKKSYHNLLHRQHEGSSKRDLLNHHHTHSHRNKKQEHKDKVMYETELGKNIVTQYRRAKRRRGSKDSEDYCFGDGIGGDSDDEDQLDDDDLDFLLYNDDEAILAKLNVPPLPAPPPPTGNNSSGKTSKRGQRLKQQPYSHTCQVGPLKKTGGGGGQRSRADVLRAQSVDDLAAKRGQATSTGGKKVMIRTNTNNGSSSNLKSNHNRGYELDQTQQQQPQNHALNKRNGGMVRNNTLPSKFESANDLSNLDSGQKYHQHLNQFHDHIYGNIDNPPPPMMPKPSSGLPIQPHCSYDYDLDWDVQKKRNAKAKKTNCYHCGHGGKCCKSKKANGPLSSSSIGAKAADYIFNFPFFNDGSEDAEALTSKKEKWARKLNEARRPATIFLLIISFVLAVTILVLYWNWSENAVRKSTKKQNVILDHWGKNAPTYTEIKSILDEVNNLMKTQELEKAAKKKKKLAKIKADNKNKQDQENGVFLKTVNDKVTTKAMTSASAFSPSTRRPPEEDKDPKTTERSGFYNANWKPAQPKEEILATEGDETQEDHDFNMSDFV